MLPATSVWFTSLVCWPAPGPPWNTTSCPSRRSTDGPPRTRRCVAAHHDRQRAVAGADVAARDGRVEGVATPRSLRGRRRSSTASDGRLDVMSTSTDRARGAQRRRRAPSSTSSHVGGVPDHREDDVALRRDRGGVVGPGGATLRRARRPWAASAWCTVTVVARVEQMAAHARAHHPSADPADARAARGRRMHRHAGQATGLAASSRPSRGSDGVAEPSWSSSCLASRK